jgi:hypothetical protein
MTFPPGLPAHNERDDGAFKSIVENNFSIRSPEFFEETLASKINKKVRESLPGFRD